MLTTVFYIAQFKHMLQELNHILMLRPEELQSCLLPQQEEPTRADDSPYQIPQLEGLPLTGQATPRSNLPRASPPTEEERLLSLLLDDDLCLTNEEEGPMRPIASMGIVPPTTDVSSFSAPYTLDEEPGPSHAHLLLVEVG